MPFLPANQQRQSTEGRLRCISMPNFIKIGQAIVEILQFFHFSIWRLASILDFPIPITTNSIIQLTTICWFSLSYVYVCVCVCSSVQYTTTINTIWTWVRPVSLVFLHLFQMSTFRDKCQWLFYRLDIVSVSQPTLPKYQTNQGQSPSSLIHSFFIAHQTHNEKGVNAFMPVLRYFTTAILLSWGKCAYTFCLSYILHGNFRSAVIWVVLVYCCSMITVQRAEHLTQPFHRHSFQPNSWH